MRCALGVCTVIPSMEMFGIEMTMTNSAETARAIFRTSDAILASLKECPKTASKG
jgi:hypothetical protein